MDRFIRSLKKHIAEYFLFYLLVYGLFNPLWIRLLPILFLKNLIVFNFKNNDLNFNNIYFLLAAHVSGLLTVVAATIKRRSPKFKNVHRILFGVGLLIQSFFFAELLAPALSDATVALAVFIYLVPAILWTAIYLLAPLNFNKEKNRILGKKLLKYVVLCGTLLYVASSFWAKYYSNQVKEIIENEKVWQAVGWLFLIQTFVLTLFFYFYRRIIVNIKNSGQLE